MTERLGNMHTDLTYVDGLGHASNCSAYGMHRPRPLRFIWHHVLPAVCGGPTNAANLVSLCDTCHYSVHALMYLLAGNAGQTSAIHGWSRLGTKTQRQLALRGYADAVRLGTVDKIPDEGISAVS